jgi:hypothetical protein
MPQILSTVSSDTPLWVSDKSAVDDPHVPGSVWKFIAEMATELTARKVRIYAGATNGFVSPMPAGANGGMLAITVNAHWHLGAPNRWQRDIGGTDAFAFLVINERLVISRQPASVLTDWNVWPTDQGSLYVGNDVTIGGNQSYPAPVRRRTLMNINKASGPVYRNDADGSITFDSTRTNNKIAFPIELPYRGEGATASAAVIIGIEVLVHQDDAGNPPTFCVFGRPTPQASFVTPTQTLEFGRGPAVTGPGATGYQTISLDPSAGGGGYAVDPTEELNVIFTHGGGIGALDAVNAICVTWDDYGLRID